MTQSDIPILILAGGASRRMAGRDKLTETVDGVPLLRLQAERALRVSKDVNVLMRPGRPDRKQALEGLDVNVIVSPHALEGMGGSLRTGIEALDDRPCVLLMLADLIDINARDLRMVIEARTTAPNALIWRGATQDNRPGHPVLFDRAVFADLKRLEGDSGGQEVMKAHADRVVLVPLPGDAARTDLDTPEDWARWRAARD
ncbi:nucleotidyltransferase family protein [Aliishimia ponticola]|uniref:nucleotidyltransferase family protein n=1 Tax=Aliishimia ponticola TaxID=2499833 RepID=UPI001FE40A2F|nr:nucleotidyltransferase family protein [Aliishimia ponticola]